MIETEDMMVYTCTVVLAGKHILTVSSISCCPVSNPRPQPKTNVMMTISAAPRQITGNNKRCIAQFSKDSLGVKTQNRFSSLSENCGGK